MTFLVVLSAPLGRSTIRSSIVPPVSPFIAWLREFRRSAWILIGLCALFRIGDAIMTQDFSADGEFAAVAGGTQ